MDDFDDLLAKLDALGPNAAAAAGGGASNKSEDNGKKTAPPPAAAVKSNGVAAAGATEGVVKSADNKIAKPTTTATTTKTAALSAPHNTSVDAEWEEMLADDWGSGWTKPQEQEQSRQAAPNNNIKPITSLPTPSAANTAAPIASSSNVKQQQPPPQPQQRPPPQQRPAPKPAPAPAPAVEEEDDGLDLLMAQALAGKGPKKTASSLSSGPAAQAKRLPSAMNATPSEKALMEKLKQFQLDLADRQSIARINTHLSWSVDFDEATDYYRKRPELTEYTLKTEIHRMQYRVTLADGRQLSNNAEIRTAIEKILEQVTAAEVDDQQQQQRQQQQNFNKDEVDEDGHRKYYTKDQQFVGYTENGDPTGAERTVADQLLLVRMSNQSLLVDIMMALKQHLVLPHDPEGSLNIAIKNSGHVRMHVDFTSLTLFAESDFDIVTMGESDDESLILATIKGEVIVRLNERSIVERVRDLQLPMVFDDDLLCAAKNLAKWLPQHLHQPPGEDTPTHSMLTSSLRIFGFGGT